MKINRRALGYALIILGIVTIFLKPLTSITGFSIANEELSIIKDVWFIFTGLGMIALATSILLARRGEVPGGFERISSPIVARKLARKIGERMATEHPEMVELYRKGGDFSRYIDIAKEYLGNEAEQYPGVCGKAIGYAMRQLMSPFERDNIRKKRKTQILEKMFGGFESEAFREHCVNARRIKEKKGISTSPEVMIQGRKQTPWTSEERKFARELIKNPEYQISLGQHKGKPDYGLIALELNIAFHNGNEVRYSKSVGNYMRDLKRRNY